MHATAFQAYMGSKEGYDALPVQARITKLSPVMQTYMKSAALGQEKPQAVETGVGVAAKDSDNESRPYSHSLRMHLQNEDRCLVCWDASHRIYNCPHRSDKLKEEMEAKKQRQGFRGSHRGGRGGRGWHGKY